MVRTLLEELLKQVVLSVPSPQAQEDAALRVAQLARAAWPSQATTALAALDLVSLLGFKQQSARGRRQAGSKAYAGTLDLLDAMAQESAQGTGAGSEAGQAAAAVKALLVQMTSSALHVTFQSESVDG